MADIFFGKFSKLIEPQNPTIIESNNKIEDHASILKKCNAKSFNKGLVYLITSYNL